MSSQVSIGTSKYIRNAVPDLGSGDAFLMLSKYTENQFLVTKNVSNSDFGRLGEVLEQFEFFLIDLEVSSKN